MNEVTYRPRNSNCVVRQTRAPLVRGLHVPDRAAEGQVYHVVAVGPAVEDLEPGDRVLMVGEAGQEYAKIPGTQDLIVIHEKNVVLVVEEASP